MSKFGLVDSLPTRLPVAFVGANPYLVSNVIGLNLLGSGTSRYGQVQGMMISPQTGKIQYLVSTTDGPQGTQIINTISKTKALIAVTGGSPISNVLVPWGSFDLNASPKTDSNPNTPVGERAFYLGAMRAVIPAGDMGSLSTISWNNLRDNYWGKGSAIPVTGGNMSGQEQVINGPIYLDSVHRLAVLDSEGKNIGKVEDIIFQPKIGQMSYIVLNQNGLLTPVPWIDMNWNESTYSTVSENTTTTSGLNVGETFYTVRMNDWASKMLADAPRWQSLSTENFNPYKTSWENSIAQYWQLTTFNSRNKNPVTGDLPKNDHATITPAVILSATLVPNVANY